MASAPPDLLPGTLDFLILRTLQKNALHGWAISERIHEVSRATLQIPQGSLYPALHRLERQRVIGATWQTSDRNQRVRIYRLTAKGRRRLAAERSRWDRLTEAIAGILTHPVERDA